MPEKGLSRVRRESARSRGAAPPPGHRVGQSYHRKARPRQSVEADPKKTGRLVGVLEYTLQPLQPTIEHKNERRQKWSLEAGCWPTPQPSEQDHLDTMRHRSRRAFRCHCLFSFMQTALLWN